MTGIVTLAPLILPEQLVRELPRGTTKRAAVQQLRRCAMSGFYDGTPYTKVYINRCRVIHQATGCVLIFTRDQFYHSSGWWKNPDYERCWHLSLSFFDLETREPAPHDQKVAMQWLDAFYGDDKRFVWAEPPVYQKQFDVWHYRVFCDSAWQSMLPRKEVYTKEFTPKGWKSYSDLKGDGDDQ